MFFNHFVPPLIACLLKVAKVLASTGRAQFHGEWFMSFLGGETDLSAPNRNNDTPYGNGFPANTVEIRFIGAPYNLISNRDARTKHSVNFLCAAQYVH